MSAAIAAMVTAVVGVLGTLFAPLVASRVTKRQRDAEGLVEERRRLLEERRTAYTSMNRATSHFHTLLKDALHRTRDGVLTDEDRERLEEGRRDYRARYAEAQMIVPEAVLDSSREVNVVLAGVDAALKRVDRGVPRDGETAVRLLLDLKAADPKLTAMHRLMRQDLGVSG
ncbi:hypothetical protein OOK43_18825 [[Kitasatospora] papulosa]|uniref:hypothetical protein n=1 Tax=Streptomyces TaxID=1883 RepID=UPI00225521AD|nr:MULTISPECIES: hypothetical protein [Streptomyces]MCX4415324.1 hypothetical protein [[Kitasatospora] papulosa]MDX3182951.1 hypothetical protein [Streptomyces sp. ME02-7008A-1]MDX3303404.1 hypothetical protein [Streptomyces sp. ME02-7008A]WJY31293.1 hypothetical protein QTO28_09895 [Streptomyces sp. P9-2B-1]